MSGLPLHPAIVHVPLGLAFVIPFVATGIAVAWRRRRLPRAAFAVVVGLQAALVAAGVVAMQAGERDEHRVERVVAERFIDAHEERAEIFVWTAGAALALAIALLVVPARATAGVAAALVFATVAVAVLAARTGEAGGEIVYLHGGAAAWSVPTAGASPAMPASQGDDDR